MDIDQPEDAITVRFDDGREYRVANGIITERTK